MSEWFTSTKPRPQDPTIANKTTSKITEQQLQKIENQWLKSDCDDLALAVNHVFALVAEVRKLRCCGNCGNWEQFD